jgi:hypothetical protein
VLIEGEIYDAFTRGDFIENDETIEVIGTEGVTLRVKKVYLNFGSLLSSVRFFLKYCLDVLPKNQEWPKEKYCTNKELTHIKSFIY